MTKADIKRKEDSGVRGGKPRKRNSVRERERGKPFPHKETRHKLYFFKEEHTRSCLSKLKKGFGHQQKERKTVKSDLLSLVSTPLRGEETLSQGTKKTGTDAPPEGRKEEKKESGLQGKRRKERGKNPAGHE